MSVAPLRVAYLMRYLPAPSETFVLDEAKALQEAGADVVAWALDRVPKAVKHARHAGLYAQARFVPRPSSLRAIMAAMVMEETPAFTAVRASWARAGRRRDLRRVAWLARAWRNSRVDIVRVHIAAETARYAVAAGAMAGIPVSIAVHGRDLFVPVDDLLWLLSNARLVTTITPFHRDRLLRAGLPSEQVELLPCPVAVPAEVAQRPEPGSPLRVLSVGRLVRKKGHDLLMEACAELAGEGAPIELTIVGGGDEGLELKGLAARLTQECSGRLSIEMLGPRPVEAVEELLSSGQFHAAALACRVASNGDRDGVPVALLEAVAHGVPVVTTALPGFAHELVDGEGAVLVQTERRGECLEPQRAPLVRALAEFYRDPSYCVEMALAARRGAEKRISPAEIGQRLLEMLMPLCSRIPAPEDGRKTWRTPSDR